MAKVKIGYSTMTEYTTLKDINFTAETDVTGSQVPIGQLAVTIKTTDDIEIANWIELYDNESHCMCKYWITDVNRIDADYVKVEGQSILVMLDRIELEPMLYDGERAWDVIIDIFAKVTAKYGVQYYSSIISSEKIYGYFPKQTARERLQQVCFSIGAYIKTYYTDKLEMWYTTPWADLIPDEKTFWRPQIEYDDIITAVKVTAYTYTQGTPQTTDKYIEDQNGDYYIVETQDFELANPNVPARCLENKVEVNLMCITIDNATDILTFLSSYYFQRMVVKADILNTNQYLPGKKVIINTGLGLVTGYITRSKYTFGGIDTKTTIEINGAEETESAFLYISCVEDTEILKELKYRLPVGYQYSIQMLYLDLMVAKKHRIIYRPLENPLTGTMPSTDDVRTVEYEKALDWLKGTLYVIDVYGVDSASGGVVEIE